MDDNHKIAWWIFGVPALLPFLAMAILWLVGKIFRTENWERKSKRPRANKPNFDSPSSDDWSGEDKKD